LIEKKIRSEELSKKQLPHQKLKPEQKADLRLVELGINLQPIVPFPE
jgi:hypothetical protein